MKVEDFIRNIDTAITKYRRLYKLLDVISITFLSYAILLITNMEMVFGMFPALEVYSAASVSVLGAGISYPRIFLFLLSLAFGLLLTFILHIRDDKRDTIDVVEEKYPVLNERLSTAYDNREVDNIIVADLRENVIRASANVIPAAFFNKKRMYIGLFSLLVAISLLTYVSVSEYRISSTPEDLKDLLDPLLPDNGGDGSDLAVMEETSDDSGNGSEEDLLGEPSVVIVEGKQVDLTLPPGTGAGFTPGEQANTTPEDFLPSYAYEISTISSSIYSEELPEGYESIIKDYFEKMAGK
ncbi:hypothetical protein [uncultured Methanomethylovorans sp.]|uniref:DUF7502 family protein n=1 Tax=uncultured Methanomethylovorans sp. TaxID=183759 RepID=UPI0026258F28|nr:hypothetical protein [uncultured Methanomethylovorans sp.]